MNRNAQGLSLQTVVIAAISLVVLIVSISIFVGKSRLFNHETSFECNSKSVEQAQNNDCPSGTIKGKGLAKGIPSVDDGKIISCCVPLGGG